MNTNRGKSLSTFIMNKWDGYNKNVRFEDDFDEDIQEFIYHIQHCSNRSQAIKLRTNALQCIDQWRLHNIKEIDQHVRLSGQLILNAYDEYQSKQHRAKCPHQLKQSIPPANQPCNSDSSEKLEQNIEISIDRSKSTSSHNLPTTKKKISFNLIDFGRDFNFETLANLSSSSNDNAMILCENNTLIYAQNSHELVILSLSNAKHILITDLNKNSFIRDLCYVKWLSKCLIITNQDIYLLDYRTTKYDIIDTGIDYQAGAIDNHNSIFYLVKQSTLYKYDKSCLVKFQADQYPIADGYHCQRITLDNKTNHYLALLVNSNDEKTYILVYSTKSFLNGYLYKIMIDDKIERKWICSNENDGWIIRGTYPGSCFDLNLNGLCSIRIFNCNEICNMISIDEHQRFIIRTNTDIFLLEKKSLVQYF